MRLFVYGTLRHGHPNARRFGLDETNLVTQGSRLNGHAIFPVSWFPGVQPSDDLSSFVIGDVFEVEDDQWRDLDQYEGVPSLYRRETVQVDGEDTEIYIYNDRLNPEDRITTGVWNG